MTCKECRFWDRPFKVTTNSKGSCHRYAPRPGDKYGWPSTNPGDWCGEYKAKPETDDA